MKITTIEKLISVLGILAVTVIATVAAVPLTAPTNVIAVRDRGPFIKITWSSGPANRTATGYKIYKSLTTNTWTVVATVQPSSQFETRVRPNEKACFAVSAVRDAEESPLSKPGCILERK